MSNTIKKEEINTGRTMGFAPTRFLVSVLNGEAMQKEAVIKNIPFIVYLVVLLIMYLGYGYYAENSLRELMKSDAKLKETKSEYVTSKSILEQKKLQSTIAQTVASTGLKESRESPYKIRTEASYFQKNN